MAAKFSRMKLEKREVTLAKKETMNFVRRKGGIRPKTLLTLILGILLALGVFVKFGIFDLYHQKTEDYQSLAAKQMQLADIQTRLEGYDTLEDTYEHYSYDWMSDSEAEIVDCMDVISLIDEKVLYCASVKNFAVSRNVLTMKLSGVTLSEASTIAKDMEESAIVDSATIRTADSDDGQAAEIVMRIVLTTAKGEVAE